MLLTRVSAAPAASQKISAVDNSLDMPLTMLRARGVLSDTDFFANLTGSAAPYSYGLNGVDQVANYFYVNIIVTFFLALCLVTFVLRLSRMANSRLRHLFALGHSNQAFWAQNRSRWLPWVKRNVSYAPLWNVRHNREIQLSSAINVGTLPSRFHTILLTVYALSNVAYCFVLDWSNPAAELTAEFRGRTGVLAAINLIPTVLFALRNNPLIPLLQVSYDTFNLLHRWTARIMITEAVAHTAAWLVNTIRAGEANGGISHVGEVLARHSSYMWGLVGTSVFVFISVQAWSPVRHAFYETFLNIHRIMVVLGLAAVYLHLDLDNLPHLPYVQFVIALWCLEWIFRIIRILYYNVSARQLTRITVEALPSEACRVTFDLVRPWHFRPGCHVHAYLPTISLWSSHPFSIAWTEDHTTPDPLSEKLPTTRPSLLRPRRPTRTSVSLVMRARTGMTRTLFNKASAAPTGTLTTWGAIEGPYGGHDSLHSYGTLVLFAGGVGITHQVGFVRDLVRGYQDGTVAARKVLLVWSVANTEALEWVRPWMDEILRMPARREVLRVHLFVTKPKSQAELVSGTGTVQMFPGRCDPQLVLNREVAERVGAMAVTVCGPGAFADSVRAAARSRVELGNVDFIEEAFTY